MIKVQSIQVAVHIFEGIFMKANPEQVTDKQFFRAMFGTFWVSVTTALIISAMFQIRVCESQSTTQYIWQTKVTKGFGQSHCPENFFNNFVIVYLPTQILLLLSMSMYLKPEADE